MIRRVAPVAHRSQSLLALNRFVSLLFAGAVVFGPAHGQSAPRPNFVLILADDLGWGDVSANNPDTPLPTPHVDRLAAEGIRFTAAHSPASVCAPTRYGLMTGRYAWRTWMREGVLYLVVPLPHPAGAIDARVTGAEARLRDRGIRQVASWIGLDAEIGRPR